MSHPIVHIEIPAGDQQTAGDFYAKLFGWNVHHMPEMQYSTFAAEGGPGGGFPAVGDMAKAGEVLIYVGTDDIDASLAQAESLGGKALAPKTEIPGIGWFGIFQDPTGNRIALFTSAE
jgi:predicted enzyme related to lactoylglutathione lyase